MAEGLTDEEMNALEKNAPASASKDVGLTDEQMDMLTKAHGTSVGSKALSAITGLGKGATAGFGPQLAGAVGAPIDAIMDDKSKPFIERYREARDFAKNINDQAQKENPKTFLGGEFLGGAAATAPLGGGSAFGAKLPNALGALGKLGGAGAEALGGGKILQALATGGAEAAPIGAAFGLGNSSADLTKPSIENLKQAAIDTGKGALMAGGTGGLLKSIPAVGESLGDYAAKRAVQVSPLTSQGLKKIAFEGGKVGGEGGGEAIRDTGHQLLDEGVIGWRNSPEAIQSRNTDLLGSSGREIDRLLKPIDDAGLKTFQPSNIQAKLLEKYGDNPVVQNQLDQTMKLLTSKGANDLSPIVGRQIRQFVDDGIPYNKSADPKMVGQLKAYTGKLVREELNRSIDEAGQHLGDESILPKFLEANSKYTLGKQVEVPVAGAVGKDFKPSSSQDAGKSWQDLIPGFRTGEKVVKEVATQPKLLDSISNALQMAPEKLGQYAPQLQQAASRGAAALASTNFVLNQKDPEYRERIRNLNGEEPQQ